MLEKTRKIFEEYLEANLENQEGNLQHWLEKVPIEDRDAFQKKVAALQSVNRALKSMPRFGETPLLSLPRQEEEPIKKKVFAGCRIIKKLGQGGMGVVYLAHQEKLKRDVVLKILRPFAADNPNLLHRFLRESEIIAGLDHRNIVPIYDVGEEEGSFYIIMKYLDGINLGELIDRLEPFNRSELTLGEVAHLIMGKNNQERPHLPGKNPTEFFLTLMREVAEAVGFAHGRGVAHRDIKPTNIIVRPDGTPILLDFGLGWVEKEKEMTLSGEFLGTPVYSAPESFESGSPENHFLLDVYSLGVTLYELVTGGLPYSGDSVYEIYGNLKNKEPTRPKIFWKDIPKDLETVILKAIAKDPEYRYPSMLAFGGDLNHFLQYQPVEAQPPSLAQRLIYFSKRNRRVLASLALGLFALTAIFYATRLSVELEKSRARAIVLKQMVNVLEARQEKAREVFRWADRINTHTATNVAEISQPSEMMAMDIDATLPWLENLQKKVPKNLAVLESLSGLYLYENENKKAKGIAEQILQIDPNNYLAYLVLADVIIVHGKDISQAAELVLNFNRYYPEEVKLNALLGTKCLVQENFKCATKFLTLAMRQNPKKYIMLLAAAFAGEGNFQEAARLHKVAIQYFLDDPELYEGLAVWLAKMDEFEEAQEYAKKAVEFDPDDAQRLKLLQAIDAHIRYQMSLRDQPS